MLPTRRAPARAMAGMSIIELMIAITLGLLVMAGLVALFANQSASRNELERSARQIENGRFAMELLGDDLRMAGFYGELGVKSIPAPGALPDPCSLVVADWIAAIPVHVQVYDEGVGAPTCIPSTTLKADTDIVVIRRTVTCMTGDAGCPAAVAGEPYVQVSRCNTEIPATPYKMGLEGTATFNLTNRNCTTGAGKWRYLVRVYYVSTDNGSGVAIPTLKRLDFDGAAFTETPLVEGIEELEIEYGVDVDGDGDPDGYGPDPATFTIAGCSTCDPVSNALNIVSARVHVLARNLESSPGFTDTKTYQLGRDAGGQTVEVTPGGNVRRHAYSGLVRIVNVSQRRDLP